MKSPVVHSFVCLTLAAALLHPVDLAGQSPESIEDTDAYAIYAVVVPPIWQQRSSETMLLQRETIAPYPGCGSLADGDPDWEAVENSLRQENIRVRALQPLLPIDIPYRLIPRAEIEADDARLAQKYPGRWQRRPESIEYAAVSAVGFNPSKTRAMVWVTDRNRVPRLLVLEVVAGEWKQARLNRGCVGPIAEAGSTIGPQAFPSVSRLGASNALLMEALHHA
jgi:hypothetical protein